jgi:cell division protein YceG involved in septum cleavage
MKAIRNFLYNKSDLVVVLIIVIIGGVLIWSKTSTLMDANANEPNAYENLDELKDKEVLNVEVSSSGISKDAIEDVAKNKDEVTTPAVVSAAATEPEPVEPEQEPATKGGSFTVKSGWISEQIANSLKSKGYIKSKKNFLKVAQKMKADTKLRSGKFKIPAGSTDKEIIKILTE